jgi:hypothetical protein
MKTINIHILSVLTLLYRFPSSASALRLTSCLDKQLGSSDRSIDEFKTFLLFGC